MHQDYTNFKGSYDTFKTHVRLARKHLKARNLLSAEQNIYQMLEHTYYVYSCWKYRAACSRIDVQMMIGHHEIALQFLDELCGELGI